VRQSIHSATDPSLLERCRPALTVSKLDVAVRDMAGADRASPRLARCL